MILWAKSSSKIKVFIIFIVIVHFEFYNGFNVNNDFMAV